MRPWCLPCMKNICAESHKAYKVSLWRLNLITAIGTIALVSIISLPLGQINILHGGHSYLNSGRHQTPLYTLHLLYSLSNSSPFVQQKNLSFLRLLKLERRKLMYGVSFRSKLFIYNFVQLIKWVSLSEPHINGCVLPGAMAILASRPGCWGHIYAFAPVHIMRTMWLVAKMAGARDRFEFSLRSASNDHYINQHDSSSPILPTINDIRCTIGNTSDYYSCTVYVLQFQDTLQRGWLKHGNRVQNCSCAQAQHIESHAGVGTHFKGPG